MMVTMAGSGSAQQQAECRHASLCPKEPSSLAETGLAESIVDSLIGKYLLANQTSRASQIADYLGLTYSIVDKQLARLRKNQLITNTDIGSLGDPTVRLTEEGHCQSKRWQDSCAYVGPAPVPLADYGTLIRQQGIRKELVDRQCVARSFDSISVRSALQSRLGPAIRSGSALFLYGSPGNGKTLIAERIAQSFSNSIWIPYSIVVDGSIINLFDPTYHEPVQTQAASSIIREEPFDRRWVCIYRPTVLAGGELTLANLEIQHDAQTNISEAPLQMKSNGGVLVIDDFGRQRVTPTDLLNRWIVPLDRGYDLLTLSIGKRITVPFESFVVFSTNLEPKELVDEAFLRRIPYKVHVSDPGEDEFRDIFRAEAEKVGIAYDDDAVSELLDKHYRDVERPLRRCHPRDFIKHLVDACAFEEKACRMDSATLDRAAHDYFLHGPSIHIDGQ